MNSAVVNRIVERYCHLYQGTPRVFGSPGRINVIGEHTDYNEGFVLPAAVNKAVYFAIESRLDRVIQLQAYDLGESFECTLDSYATVSLPAWARYQLGVVDQLLAAGYTVGGFQVVFGGDIPVGAGISSSAALECGLIFALNSLFDFGMEKLPMVKLAQKAENEFVGVKCGIMDQFASMMGQAEAVVRLDCRSLEYAYFPFKMDRYQLVLCDTGVKHSLADSAYNTRRQECEAAVAALQAVLPQIHSLRDLTPQQVEAYRGLLTENGYQRAKFITEENQRVIEACTFLSENKLEALGQLMYASHQGLQHEYEVSCPELDFLVEQARGCSGVLGSRMMGGGFGGCTLNLVAVGAIASFEQRLQVAYQQRFGRELRSYAVQITQGTSEYSLS